MASILYSLMLLLSSAVQSQLTQVSLTGVVVQTDRVNAVGNVGLSGAQLTLHPGNFRATTDLKGEFVFRNIPPGQLK
jgi:hypothetical protein